VIKILVIIPSGTVYGLQNSTLDFMRSLPKGDFDCHFFITRWADGELARRLDELKIPYTYSWLGMFSRKLDWENLRMTLQYISKIPRIYFDLISLIRKYRPNVIYTANYHELILLAPLLKAMGLPVVNHMHDPPPPILFQRAMFRFWDFPVDQYFVPSHDVQKRLEMLGGNPDQIFVLHNGIDLSSFQHEIQHSNHFLKQYKWPSQSIVLGMTGQMIEAKGHLDLIEATQLLCKDYPNVRLAIGGKQEGPFYQRLILEVENRGLSDTVVFSGWQEDIRDFYSSIDIFILPSRHDEGFGLVVAQAMTMRLPVVATRSGGVNEVVEDRVTGFLVKKESPSELARAISHLVQSKPLRQSMGAAGRKRIEERFDLSKQSARLETVLKVLTNGVQR